MSNLSKKRLTVFPNGVAGFYVDSNAEEKTANYTVVINDDSGKTFISELDGIVFQMPPIVIGNSITFINMANDGTAALFLSPDAADGITYVGGFADDDDLVNTKATAKKGDFVTLNSLNGVSDWKVTAVRGIWAKV